ncbi:MAG TPA: hypothetical protein VGP13_01080, partial [Candidatus Paceibacterota bacterium]|nr:hypothetical protein [Candidatus Paceibacterota bacterium]
MSSDLFGGLLPEATKSEPAAATPQQEAKKVAPVAPTSVPEDTARNYSKHLQAEAVEADSAEDVWRRRQIAAVDRFLAMELNPQPLDEETL